MASGRLANRLDAARAPSSSNLLSGGGKSAPDATLRTPDGAGRNGTRLEPIAWNASNSSGAAAVRPSSPGDGTMSGRPTHTPTVCRPSKPIAHASRYPYDVPVLKAIRPPLALGGGGASPRMRLM